MLSQDSVIFLEWFRTWILKSHSMLQLCLSHIVASVVSDCANLWTVACQAPLSMGFSKARILEWVAMLSSRGPSRPRDPTRDFCVSCRQILYR